ncbi:hypothetical protein JOC54_003633 [Alkalihalobacillus xiaoxiensis]|uniref:Uncharacterized protein n=1 Tax=Shouchella xiaoxiensis TaxID=766895 RepID=A0ABS2SXU3_9BACI|nr:hypothetical protein [Shouchella xiaoxiensis]
MNYKKARPGYFVNKQTQSKPQQGNKNSTGCCCGKKRPN